MGKLSTPAAILVQGGIIKFGKQTSTVSSTTQAALPNQAPPTEPSAGPVEPLKDEDHVRGVRSARILLFEYSDLECPFCKRFHPTAKQIVDEYKGQVAWVYRHFPLDQNKFKSCLDSGKYADHIDEDYQGGIKAGITGTPGNILLDTKTNKTKLIPGAVPFEQFKTAIDDMLKS